MVFGAIPSKVLDTCTFHQYLPDILKSLISVKVGDWYDISVASFLS